MNNRNNLFKKLPYELKNIIFEYDGRIKYKYKQKNHIDYHKFVNIIHKYDERYNIITPIINKKIEILQNAEVSKNGFYFEFEFDKQPNIALCYDYNFSYTDTFEICYTDMRDSGHIFGSDQIRTII
tara:strand:+ start:1998 stop:2375 length:378 start_codon:yes stop_codon:yes gene_type:complete